MKKYILSLLFFVPFITQASVLTTAQMNALLNMISVFGASNITMTMEANGVNFFINTQQTQQVVQTYSAPQNVVATAPAPVITQPTIPTVCVDNNPYLNLTVATTTGYLHYYATYTSTCPINPNTTKWYLKFVGNASMTKGDTGGFSADELNNTSIGYAAVTESDSPVLSTLTVGSTSVSVLTSF